MRPVEFEGQTTLLGPPQKTPRGVCGALPVLIRPDSDWGQGFYSFWKPSPEELAAINAGAHVQLFIGGAAHPPVWLDVHKVEELP